MWICGVDRLINLFTFGGGEVNSGTPDKSWMSAGGNLTTRLIKTLVYGVVTINWHAQKYGWNLISV